MAVCIITGFILGLIIGYAIACLLCVNKKDATTTIKMFEGAAEHEREIAIKEKQDVNYINGMGVIISLFKKYFEEELD